jgi:predicted dehydrogenase
MIKIGLVNIDTSHPMIFSKLLNLNQRARFTAVFNDGFRGNDEVEGFMKMAGVEKRCSSIEELAKSVDIGFVQSCNWDKHIEQAEYFVKAGKPVFIDKPIVGNLANCKKLEQLAISGAIILGSSSVRYAKEIEDFLNQAESQRGRIVSMFGTAGVDNFYYAIHIVEALHQLSQEGVIDCKFVGKTKVEDKICETYFITFKNGVTASYCSFIGLWQPFELVIMTTKGMHTFQIAAETSYVQMLNKICDFMETGKSTLAPVEHLTEAIKVMLAARISCLAEGKKIKLSDIPIDDPGFNGYEFEKEYSANAKKIYI